MAVAEGLCLVELVGSARTSRCFFIDVGRCCRGRRQAKLQQAGDAQLQHGPHAQVRADGVGDLAIIRFSTSTAALTILPVPVPEMTVALVWAAEQLVSPARRPTAAACGWAWKVW